MTIGIDLYGRYQAAFGYVARVGRAELNTALIRSNLITFKDAAYNTPENNQEMLLYENGDASFADLELTNDKAGYKFKFAITSKNDLNNGILAPPPMVRFNNSKNIIRTVIDNSDYEVVESFGNKSWEIVLEGILIDIDNHWYPGEFLKEIKKMFFLNDTYKVVSQILNDLDIHELYFDELPDLTFVEGFNDTIKFNLKARSIKPTEFFI